MSKTHEPKFEDTILSIAIACLCVVLIVPFTLWKSVQGAPEYYQRLTKRQYLTRSVLFILSALFLYGANRIFPELSKSVLVEIGKLKVYSEFLIQWILLNLFLAGILFPTIPVWIKFLPKKNNLKDDLY